ncbi:unnamed protein product [Caenorhabditis bovis]|uniref:Uncharacterized protein n=1 Tax=Caenorhabditis bovis TaxID=2654633 RepID=A0A8S1EY92_9PELO|nr:unnamed protein product [Caenorhabditis bovis]
MFGLAQQNPNGLCSQLCAFLRHRNVELMSSKQDTSAPQGYNMGHRHSLTIETNPLHLLPSNMRRFSQADTARHPAAPLLSKLAARQQIPEAVAEKKDDDEQQQPKPEEK